MISTGRAARNRRWLQTSIASLVLAVMIALAPDARALPEVKVGNGYEVTPANAWTYYQAQGLTSPTWSEEAEIDRLAAALGDDPDRIYAYVHDEIDLIPLFGSKAGARGAYIDKAGTPFDQAQLMVELLRSAGFTATYQLGTITLTGTQFNDWFGITNAAAARKLLADGGTPATVSDNGSTVTSVTMMHVWVRATISGTTYSFDPAFKQHTVTAGIDVGSAMGFNAATFFSNAISGATTATDNSTPRVHTLNRTNVRSNLATYATALLTHINTNLANGAIEDVIGGRAPIAYAGAPLRQTSLPYQAGTYTTFTGDLPVALRTRVSVTFCGNGNQQTLNWNLDDIYGQQIAFVANQMNPQPPTPSTYTLKLGGQVVATCPAGTVGGATIAINHAYAGGTSSGVVDGTYLDHAVEAPGVVTGALQLFIGAGRASGDLAAWQERTHAGNEEYTVFDFTTPASEEPDLQPQPQQVATRRRMGTGFLVQFAEMVKLIAGVSNAEILVHDVIGGVATAPTFATSGFSPGPVGTSFVLTMEPTVSAISKTGDTAQHAPVARTVATMLSALEGASAETQADSVYPVSAVAQFDWAHDGPATGDRWFYYATSANWTWAKAQMLLDYNGIARAANVAESYINAGYTVFIPRSSSLGPAPATLQPKSSQGNPMGPVTHPDRAGAFIAIHPTTGAIAHISTREYNGAKGGGGTNNVETDPGRLFAIGEDFLDKQFSNRASAGSVDLKTGTLAYTPAPDLVVGNGGYPYSLSFQRSYRSGAFDNDVELSEMDQYPKTHMPPAQTRDPLFGSNGWSTNLWHHARVSSSAEQAFGRDDPRVAVQALVLAKVLSASLTNGATNLEMLQRQIVGAYAAYWWTDSFDTNTITVSQGHSSRSFTKLHDGTFAARGSQETAELLGTRTVHQLSWGPARWWYKYCVRITGAQREVSNYGVWNGGYTSCVGETAAPSDFNNGYEQMTFARQVFPFGVTVTWDKTTKVLSNNLGRSITLSNAGAEWSACRSGSTAECVRLQSPDAGMATNYARFRADATDAMNNVWRYATVNNGFEAYPPTTPTAYMTRYEYQPGTNGVVERVKDAHGNATTYKLGGGRVAAVIDPLGNTSRAYHDRSGQLVRSIDPLGRTTLTTYDNHRRTLSATAPEGDREDYEYDARHNRTKTTETPKPGSGLPARNTQATYDTLCNVPLTQTDALGRVTTSAINQTTCRTNSVTEPAVGGSSPVTSYTYNSFGQVTTKTDPTGLVTQTTYNASNGNVESVILDPGAGHVAATTLFQYDAIGNVTQLTDPRSNVHLATYDNMRRLTQYTAPFSTSAVTKWTYDADGLITKIERATGDGGNPWAATTYAYWPTGRVRSTTDADGRVTRFDYDAANRPTFVTDPELRRALKLYDAAGQVIEERRAVGTSIEQAYATYGYTANGKQAWVKDAKNNQTTYTYDGFDRSLRTTFPDATYEELGYNLKDSVTSKLTRGGQLIQNTYDTLDRMATHLVPQPGGAPAILTTYAYDLAGRTTSVSDNTGHSLTNAFDTAKRIISVTQAAPNFAGTRVVSYQLDTASNKTRATWADGYYVTYAFDAMNRMTTVTENGTFVLATYLWNPLSRRTSLVYGNGASQSYTYSTQGDMLTLAHTLSGTANTYTNTFSKAHQIASEVASNAAWQFVPAVFQSTNYAAANNLNQYVNLTVGANPTTTLGYDANGNLTGDGTWTFAYDAQNILRTATASGTSATYAYDPLGRRQAKVVNSVTTTFLSDGDEEIAEYDGAAALLRRYVPGPGTDMPIAMVTAAGTRSYFHTNRQGSVVAMSAANGTIAEGPYTYDEFGNGAPTTGVPFKYTGRRLDPETGLYYYRARYYSTSLGRFLQTDPVGYGDQINLYAYVANDPLNKADPTGKVIDTILDVGFLVYDVGALVYDEATTGGANREENLLALGADAAGTLIPFATGGGLAVRAAMHADDVADAARGIDRVAGATVAAKTCCFVAGTLVATKDGLSPIETIKEGDLVLSRDENTGETAYKPVTDLIRRHDRIIWKLTLTSADDGGDKAITAVFQTTDDHPWRTTAGFWVKTMDLKPGVEIVRARGPPAKVISFENTGKGQSTFNLEIADYHTYFVGDAQVWVHNADCGLTETGSYTNLHESGMNYHGKGDRQRSQDSGKRIADERKDPHVATEWTPAASERDAFKQESRRLDADGGVKSPTNYNQKESPGKRMRIEDGEIAK